MNKNILNTIETVTNSFPSLYTKEDVIKLLTDLNAKLEQDVPVIFDKESMLNTFRERIKQIDYDASIDTEGIELSIGWNNQIEVDRVTLDEFQLIDEIVDTLDNVWDDLTNQD